MLLASTSTAQAQTTSGENLTVTLVTIGPGPDLFSWAGHSALVVADSRGGEPLLYDYGVMSAWSDTWPALLRGTPVLMAVAHRAAPELASWRRAGRSVQLRELQLLPAQRLDLYTRLLADENRGRPAAIYDLQWNNCTSRIRDLIDSVTGGALRAAGAGLTGHTAREIFFGYFPDSWQLLAFNLLLNNHVDRPLSAWDAALFPEYLSRLVATAGLGRVPAGGSDISGVPWTPAQSVAHHDASILAIGACIGLILLLLSRRQGRSARVAFGAIVASACALSGFAGTVLLYNWIATAYTFAPHNESLLIVHPFLLLGVPLGIAYAAGSDRARIGLQRLAQLSAAMVLFDLVLKVTLPTPQGNRHILLLVAPVIAGVFVATLDRGRLSSAVRAPATHARPVTVHEYIPVHNRMES